MARWKGLMQARCGQYVLGRKGQVRVLGRLGTEESTLWVRCAPYPVDSLLNRSVPEEEVDQQGSEEQRLRNPRCQRHVRFLSSTLARLLRAAERFRKQTFGRRMEHIPLRPSQGRCGYMPCLELTSLREGAVEKKVMRLRGLVAQVSTRIGSLFLYFVLLFFSPSVAPQRLPGHFQWPGSPETDSTGIQRPGVDLLPAGKPRETCSCRCGRGA